MREVPSSTRSRGKFEGGLIFDYGSYRLLES